MKRIMRRFALKEISGVDRPAQQGARVVIMKRDDAEHADERPTLSAPGESAPFTTSCERDSTFSR